MLLWTSITASLSPMSMPYPPMPWTTLFRTARPLAPVAPAPAVMFCTSMPVAASPLPPRTSSHSTVT